MKTTPWTHAEIKRQLELSWEAYEMDNDACALERLHMAVSMIAEKLAEQDRSIYQASNIASCLANGIKPD